MVRFFLRVFEYFQRRHRLCMGLMIVLMAVLMGMTATLRYNENIFDFLPISGNDQKALTLYQDISGGQSLFALFSLTDEEAGRERLTEAVDAFTEKVQTGAGSRHITEVTSQVDFDKVLGITDFVYQNIPVMLTDSDYIRMERQLAEPDFVERELANDVQMIMMPATGILTPSIGYDPLELFAPVMERLQARMNNLPVEIDDGYIYTPGQQYAVAVMKSPYGAMESAQNSQLVTYVDSVAQATMDAVSGVRVAVTGAPVIAVGNAKQIKTDSQWAISIAVTLIIFLLAFAFRRVKQHLLIALSILFGWLFAMGFIAVLRTDVSLIVLGIGSIIIGIAVNYPLHFIAHTDHGGTAREVLKDMIAPLLIGNITTVGAFASLLPLDAPALRDLGLFAAFMLIGTILFVLIFLPQLVKAKEGAGEERLVFGWLISLTSSRSEGRRTRRGEGLLALAILVLTLIFGYFSLGTSFDTNIDHINYMTAEQRELLNGLNVSAGINDTTNVYIVTEGDTWEQALSERSRIAPRLDSLRRAKAIGDYSDVTAFICSTAEQQRRIGLWNSFWEKHREAVLAQLSQKAPQHGFSADAFNGFSDLLAASYAPQPFEHFEPIQSVLLNNSFSTSTGRCAVVDAIAMKDSSLTAQALESELNACLGDGGYSFDFVGINSSVAESLSADFNYIGFACSFIVFLFLWLSFGRLELSILAFLPMAVGWVWILGIMYLCGIQFNIVNVILATFIFGQGDDYTIFMTDGLINEFAYRKKLLPSFKNSIIISALIMFIGMGSLIIARHPALHSLAEVTIVGMLSVVLMAWIVPTLAFGWLVRDGQGIRRIPVTLGQVFRGIYFSVLQMIGICETYVFGLRLIITHHSSIINHHSSLITHHSSIITHHIWGVKVVEHKNSGERFERGAVTAWHRDSLLDWMLILAQSPRIVLAAEDEGWRSPLRHLLFKASGGIDTRQLATVFKEQVADALQKGRIVAVWHEQACALAKELGADFLPIVVHGTEDVQPAANGLLARGRIDILIGQRVPASAEVDVQTLYHQLREQWKRQIENTHYFHHYLIYKYTYKGYGIEKETRRLLKRYDDFSQWIDNCPILEGANVPSGRAVHCLNAGRGQFPLLFALVHPDAVIHSYTFDEDDAALARACEPLPANLHVHYYKNLALAKEAIGEGETIDLSEIMV